MANVITTQVLLDGTRNTKIKVNIQGDGSGDETDTVIFNAPDYVGGNIADKLMEIEYSLNDFDGELFWDATTPVQLITLSRNYEQHVTYFDDGGLTNNAGAGKNGNILLTTTGMIGAPTSGHIILYIKKKTL